MIGLSFPEDLFSEESQGNTQRRINDMLNEFQSWRDWNDLEIGRGVFESNSRDLVIVKAIPYFSWCEHHLMPFQGTAAIAYLPGGHLVGLSKLARTVRKFASRPQLQEQLTNDIANYLEKWIPNNLGVMVFMTGKHLCMEARGARMQGETVTSAVRGKFAENPSLKDEALELMR